MSSPWLSSVRRSTSTITTNPMGTFNQKIHSQPIVAVIAPPTTEPAMSANPVMPSRIPIAAPRPFGGYAALTRASARDNTSAAPTP